MRDRRAIAVAREEERFWGHVDKSGDCWLWTASRNKQGYGSFTLAAPKETGGRTTRAHRYAYEKTVGPIPDGLFLLHSCDNPPCVNPAHLRPGTASDNSEDASARGRFPNSQATHCPEGHPYDEANTRIRPEGWRACRACYRESSRARREDRECPHCGAVRDYSNMSRHIRTMHKEEQA